MREYTCVSEGLPPLAFQLPEGLDPAVAYLDLLWLSRKLVALCDPAPRSVLWRRDDGLEGVTALRVRVLPMFRPSTEAATLDDSARARLHAALRTLDQRLAVVVLRTPDAPPEEIATTEAWKERTEEPSPRPCWVIFPRNEQGIALGKNSAKSFALHEGAPPRPEVPEWVYERARAYLRAPLTGVGSSL